MRRNSLVVPDDEIAESAWSHRDRRFWVVAADLLLLIGAVNFAVWTFAAAAATPRFYLYFTRLRSSHLSGWFVIITLGCLVWFLRETVWRRPGRHWLTGLAIVACAGLAAAAVTGGGETWNLEALACWYGNHFWLLILIMLPGFIYSCIRWVKSSDEEIFSNE